jgi:hypothetical protein
VFTEVVYSRPGNGLWNTDAWEVASRYQYKIQLESNPEFAEILSILQDERNRPALPFGWGRNGLDWWL